MANAAGIVGARWNVARVIRNWIALSVTILTISVSRAQNTDVYAPQGSATYNQENRDAFNWDTAATDWTVNGVQGQAFQNGDNVYFDDSVPVFVQVVSNTQIFGPPVTFINSSVFPSSITVVSQNPNSAFFFANLGGGSDIGDFNSNTPTSFTKLGPGGTLFVDFSPVQYTFTGPINIYQGNFSVFLGDGSQGFSGQGGTTNFPFKNPAVNMFSPNSTLVLGGGTYYQDTLGVVGSQTFKQTNLATGSSLIRMQAAHALGGSQINGTLNLSSITRSVGGTVDIEFALDSDPTFVATAITNIGGILGGWATCNTFDWASVNSTGDIVPLSSNGGYTPDLWLASTNTDVTAVDVIPANSTTNSLRFNTAITNSVTVSGANTITTGGVLVTTNVGANNTTISGGSLTSGNGQDLIVFQNNQQGSLTLASQLTDNGGTPIGFTLTGGGVTALTNTNNTYSGPTTINGGNTAYTLVTTATQNGTITNLVGPVSTSATLSVAKLANGGSPSSIGQSSNAASNLVINGGTLQYVGSGDSTDRLFTIGANGATIDSSGTGPLNLTNTGSPVIAQNTPQTFTLTGSNSGTNTFTPVLTDPTPANANAFVYQTSLVKNGAGSWTLASPNTYSGGTTINGGTLTVTNTTGSGTGSGVIAVSNATLVNNGSINATSPAGGSRAITLANATITNNGPLTADSTAVGEDAIFCTSSSFANITNNSTMTLNGNEGIGDGNSGQIINNGIIMGTTTGGFGSTTVDIGGTVVCTNNGSIAATVNSNGGGVFVNNGTFINNVTGSVTGPQATAGFFEFFATAVNDGSVDVPLEALGGTISGTGTFSGSTNVAEQVGLQPDDGTTAGKMTFKNSLELDEFSSFNFMLDKPNDFGPAGGNDLIEVLAGNYGGNGDLILQDSLQTLITAGPHFGPGVYELIHFTGAFTDDTSDFMDWTAQLENSDAQYNYAFSVDQADGELLLTVTPIPEPASIAIVLLSGMAMIAGRRTRRRARV
jgi:autotransporter-associated beta strand protein